MAIQKCGIPWLWVIKKFYEDDNRLLDEEVAPEDGKVPLKESERIHLCQEEVHMDAKCRKGCGIR